ncbi:MAG: TetR/AcrR family transcriptional regulator [Lysobacter sp.]
MNTAAALDVRQHIIDVALPLLLRKGFTAVGLTEILATAQVPKGSFYHYFGSKEAFGEAVLETYFDGYLSQMDALLAQPGTAAQRLDAYFGDWIDSQTGEESKSRCPVVKLGAEVSDLSESMRAALARGTHAVIERLARCIQAGRADGSLAPAADSQTLALTLYQNWLGASLLAKIGRDRTPLDTAMAATRQALGLISQV